MTLKHLFPTVKPTLDLNFAAARQLDPRITFTRSSIGTYIDEDGILRYAAEDEPRFDHDGGTGESLGLLIEEARTNSIEFSEDFSVLSQLNNGDGVPPVLDGTLYEAPDGSLTAQRWTLQITDTTDAGNQSTLQASATGIPEAAYVTVWAKSATGADQTVFLTSDANDTFTVTNRWQRFDLGPRGTIPFRCAARGTYTDAVVDVLLWGLQAEAGDFATSYIPTSGTTEDRSPDVANVTGTNFSSWYNGSQGSFVAMCDYKKNSVYNMIVEGVGGGTFRDFSVGVGAGNPSFTTRYSYTALDIVPAGGPILNNTPFKLAGAYSSSGSAAVFNGGAVGTTGAITSARTPADSMTIGHRIGGGLNLNGHISRLSYYPFRLSDEQLQALTS